LNLINPIESQLAEITQLVLVQTLKPPITSTDRPHAPQTRE
jgi:hypothetical protein